MSCSLSVLSSPHCTALFLLDFKGSMSQKWGHTDEVHIKALVINGSAPLSTQGRQKSTLNARKSITTHRRPHTASSLCIYLFLISTGHKPPFHNMIFAEQKIHGVRSRGALRTDTLDKNNCNDLPRALESKTA